MIYNNSLQVARNARASLGVNQKHQNQEVLPEGLTVPVPGDGVKDGRMAFKEIAVKLYINSIPICKRKYCRS